jgi:hypothetical protein
MRGGRSENRPERAPFRRHPQSAHRRGGRRDLGQRCQEGEGAALRVCAAAAGQVDVTDVGRRTDAMGVIQQRVEVGQGKPAPDKERGQEQREETVWAATSHATSLERRLCFVYGPASGRR